MAARPAATQVRVPRIIAAAAAIFSLANIMDLMACFIRATVVVETVPAATVSPRAMWPAARVVARRSVVETAEAVRPAIPAPNAVVAKATPRRVSRSRSRALPRASRPRVVAFTPPQMIGGLLVGHVLQVAEDDGPSITFGEPVDLLVEHGTGVVPGRARGHSLACQLGGPLFLTAAPEGVGLDLKRDAPGHAMEPAADRSVDPDRPGLASQQQEGGLEGVVGIVGIVEDPAADGHDHPPMTLDQGLEGELVSVRHVTFQHRTVGETRQGPLVEEAVDLPQGGAASCTGHVALPQNSRGSYPY